MQKKYIVRLSESEHQHLEEIVKPLSGSSQKVRRAQILLKTDIEEPTGVTRALQMPITATDRP